MGGHEDQAVSVSTAEGDGSAGGRLVASDGRILALRGISIAADARGGLARVVVRQRFVNEYPEALRVSYLVPLPADGAVAGYSFDVGDRRITGEVDRIEAARERFETALLEGRSAGHVEQARSNLFAQEIGNIPSGARVVAEIVIDQPLTWLEEGAWEWRFPTVVAPRYLGGHGRVADADRVTVDVADDGLDVSADVALTVRDEVLVGGTATSPSHPLATVATSTGLEVKLASERIALDRDVVVRWPVAGPSPGLILDTGRPRAGHAHRGSAYGLLTVVPPTPDSGPTALPRDLIVLIDTSGSMTGEPLTQACAVARSLVESLTDADQLEIIHFSSQPHRWRRHAVRATTAARRDAVAWIGALSAQGSTEMRQAVTEALRPLRHDAQRQVVLMTDGLIGFENEIVATLTHELPAGSRLHTVGVGPSVNRALTAPAARAGRGVEIVLGLGEEVKPHVGRLLSRMRAPILTEIKLSGSSLLNQAPEKAPDVHAGAPLRLAVELRAEGGDLVVHGRTANGAWEGHVAVPPVMEGEGNPAVVSLFGREYIEDLEMQCAAGVEAVDREIERIGLEFQIATRLTSWVAVGEEPLVDPTQPVRRERIPHALPAGLSAEGLGLRGQTRGLGARVRVERQIDSRDVSERVHFMAFDTASPNVAKRSGQGRPGPVYKAAADPPGRFAALRSMRRSPHARGRIVLRKERDLTIEIDVESALDWRPEKASVVWSDGTGVPAEIITEHTTSPVLLVKGLTARLSLRLTADGSPEPPDRIVLKMASELLIVVLRRA